MRIGPCLALVALSVLPGYSTAQELTAVNVDLARGTTAERLTLVTLQEILRRSEIRPFLLERRVVIEEGAIPRSHPIVTINTQFADDPERLMALFVHEQLHHFERPGADYEGAVEALGRIFPDPPLSPPEGALTRSGTYLHLIVCDLELAALTRLLGKERAAHLLRTSQVYQWVYRTVLEDPRVREIAEAHGFTIDYLLQIEGAAS